jgi:hypothetical protein
MRIDRRLNLVVPVEREGEANVYVHSMPISRAVFEDHFLILGQAYSMIYDGGIGVTSGPRVAAMIIRRVAERLGLWEGEGGAGNALMNEIRRLSNAIVPNPKGGWQTLPFETVRERVGQENETLSADEVGEVENAICFFIVASAMHKKAVLPGILGLVGSLWETQITYSNVTDFAASLPTWTKADSSETKTESSPPS